MDTQRRISLIILYGYKNMHPINHINLHTLPIEFQLLILRMKVHKVNVIKPEHDY